MRSSTSRQLEHVRAWMGSSDPLMWIRAYDKAMEGDDEMVRDYVAHHLHSLKHTGAHLLWLLMTTPRTFKAYRKAHVAESMGHVITNSLGDLRPSFERVRYLYIWRVFRRVPFVYAHRMGVQMMALDGTMASDVGYGMESVGRVMPHSHLCVWRDKMRGGRQGAEMTASATCLTHTYQAGGWCAFGGWTPDPQDYNLVDSSGDDVWTLTHGPLVRARLTELYQQGIGLVDEDQRIQA